MSAEIERRPISTWEAGGFGPATHAALPSETERDVVRTLAPLSRPGRLWVAGLVAVIALGLVAYALQLARGLAVTGLREYVSWGVYMTNFVFFMGVSYAGTLISAILRITGAEWRRPITRMAEGITLFALLVGAPMVIVDMGRPDRLHHVLLYGRPQSPILWDVLSISTYIAGSALYLYVAMLPDLALLGERLRDSSPRRARLFRSLALGFRGTPRQHRYLSRALAAAAVVIIPVAISAHTVVSWIFAVTLRPGWHSTIFGPYFVVAAIFSGTAAIITAMAVFRRLHRLERYLTWQHFRNLGTLLLALDLLYLYFALSEYLTSWFGAEHADARLLELLMGKGTYGLMFWGWVVFGLIVPLLLLAFPRGSIKPIVVASVLVNVGMWVKRYLIVVPTMLTPYIPPEAAGKTASYAPTWVEWAVTAAGFAFFLLAFTVFAKVFPILSIWEIEEGESGPHREAGGEHTALRPAVLAMVGVLALGATGRAAAQETSPELPAATVAGASLAIAPGVEEGEAVIVATVTRNGVPVEGARVAIFVQRTFGRMKLGEEETIDDGTALAPFPKGLPGDAAGRLRVIAEITEPEELAGVRAETQVPGGAVVRRRAEPFPRAMWSSQAPLPLILAITVLFTGVWLTYAFIAYQLVLIRKEKLP